MHGHISAGMVGAAVKVGMEVWQVRVCVRVCVCVRVRGVRYNLVARIGRVLAGRASHQKKTGVYSLCKKAVAFTMRVLRLCDSAFRLGNNTSR